MPPHLPHIGSQTPEPRGNPAHDKEAPNAKMARGASDRLRQPLLPMSLEEQLSETRKQFDGLDEWEVDESARKKAAARQAALKRQYVQHAQRELHRQREQVMNLRAENALLRSKAQAKMAEQSSVLDDRHAAQVNHLMGLKFDLQKEVEDELEHFEKLKKRYREMQSKVKELALADKSNLFDERKCEKTRRLHEDRIQTYTSKHSEQVSINKRLRAVIDELRHDKMNAKERILQRQSEVDERSTEAVQLINIANTFYMQRSQDRLKAAELVADAGGEAEEHRAKMQELNNRIEYYDLVMQEREDEYNKMIVEAEQRAANLNDPAEELRESEKKRHRDLIEAFDKLMHRSGIWDVDELVSKFLQKNEKMDIGKNYLEALNEDAAKIQEEISRLEKEADERRKQLPAEDVEVLALKRSITVVEAKSSALREQSDQGIELLDTVCGVLDRIKARMDRCPALLEFHPVKRRWALLRANVRRIPLLFSRSDPGAARVKGGGETRAAKFDPRRKTMIEQLREVSEHEAAAQGLKALESVATIEKRTMLLLNKAQLNWQQGQQIAKALTQPIKKVVEEEPVVVTSTMSREGRRKGRKKRVDILRADSSTGDHSHSPLGSRGSSRTEVSRTNSRSPPRSSFRSPRRTPLEGARGRSPGAGDREQKSSYPARPAPALGSPEFHPGNGREKPNAAEGAAHHSLDPYCEQDGAPDKGLFPGPADAVLEDKQIRAVVRVMPSLKDIDSPRDNEPLSPSEIRQQVTESGYSEKVQERIKRLEVQKEMADKQRQLQHQKSAQNNAVGGSPY